MNSAYDSNNNIDYSLLFFSRCDEMIPAFDVSICKRNHFFLSTTALRTESVRAGVHALHETCCFCEFIEIDKSW